ncbi:hypothetical protein IFR05_011189, partial [Cadophora sp. M221]
MSQSSRSEPATRYHHFVPQFLLKNFAHKYKGGSRRGGKARKSKSGIYPGEIVVNSLKLKGSKAEFQESKVAKTFGIQDLYIDVGSNQNQQHIEKMLGTLENQAAKITSTIQAKFEAGDKEFSLHRSEKDTLRKFLFIMKYRRPEVRRRFSGDSASDYKGDDKDLLIEYMLRRSFRRPIEVWLANIKAMLEINMDITSDWKAELGNKAYHLDADWFIAQETMYYLSFCAPSDPADEFLMTENGYGVYEGPTSTQKCSETDEVKVTVFSEYHTFAHISPKLTMVLRAAILPLPIEDTDEEVKSFRSEMLEMTLLQHNFPATSNSFLLGLPVTKPQNSYTGYVGGFPTHNGDKLPHLSSNDVFRFRFFHICEEHVQKINMVCLQEAYPTDIIVFKRKESLRKALEFYLRYEDKDHGFKQIVTKYDDDEMLRYLRRLEEAVIILGGSAVAKFVLQEDFRLAMATADTLFDLISGDKECGEIYSKLCGKQELDPRDFEQAVIMLKLRIRIDTWTKGLTESFRNRVRQDLAEFYCQLPIQRLWIYLKRVRFMSKSNGGIIIDLRDKVQDMHLDGSLLRGPEDEIAKVCKLFRAGHATRIMYYATTIHIRRTDPDFGLHGKALTFDDEGARRYHQDLTLAFGPQGVPRIEELSRYIRGMLIQNGLPDFGGLGELFNGTLSPAEQLEMAIRAGLEGGFGFEEVPVAQDGIIGELLRLFLRV